MKHRLDLGEKVILDNGAYEGVQLQSDELLRWVLKLHPTVMILPDVVGDWSTTLERSLRFKRALNEVNFHGQTMYVLHTDGQWVNTSAAYAGGLELEVDYIGFSRLTPKFSEEGGLGIGKRAAALLMLKTSYTLSSKIKHHALGMLDGNLQELPLLQEVGFHSIDSSSPIWRGLCGYHMYDKWINAEFDPMNMPVASMQYGEKNLVEVLHRCK